MKSFFYILNLLLGMFSCDMRESSSACLRIDEVDRIYYEYSIDSNTRGLDTIILNGDRLQFSNDFHVNPEELKVYNINCNEIAYLLAYSKPVLCNSLNCDAQIVLIKSENIEKVHRFKTFLFSRDCISCSEEKGLIIERNSFYEFSDSSIIFVKSIYFLSNENIVIKDTFDIMR